MSATRRRTRQQAAVMEQLAASDDFTSAQDLHARMRQAGATVGLATVYRTLATAAADGELDTIRTAEGESVYRVCSTGHHHHHLVCRGCGRTVEIDGPAVERWTDSVAAEHGFSDVEHTLEIFGTCRPCRDA